MPNQQLAPGSALGTPAWARERLNVSRQTLLSIEAGGHLHPVRLPSGQRRYLVAEVEALAAPAPAASPAPTSTEAGDE